MPTILSKKSKAQESFVRIERRREIAVIHFTAMASPCEVHLVCTDGKIVEQAAVMAQNEALRIEQKFSRYRDDSIVYQINNASGASIPIDTETFQLLELAARCHDASNGKFDITSGILRRAWKFDGQAFTPDENQIKSLLEHVGWEKVSLTSASTQMPSGMEIDLGGIGKEYAVDRIAQMLFDELDIPLLVNFGGDVRVITPVGVSREWRIGIEDPGFVASTKKSNAIGILGQVTISSGGVATSGDARRYCIVDGHRLSHILDPTTGWPVKNAPRSVTVIGTNCLEAGLFATLAMLHGIKAEEFLETEGLTNHVVR